MLDAFESLATEEREDVRSLGFLRHLVEREHFC